MATTANLDPPVLPLDLEREIFELAAHSQPTSIPRLMLVASRVKIWLEPLLYRTLFLTHDDQVVDGYPTLPCKSFSQIIRDKPTSLIQKSVRHVFLSHVPDEDVTWLLTTCTRIGNLFVMGFQIDKHLPVISALPLERLDCDLRGLFSGISGIEFTHTLFSHLTHLRYFGRVGTPDTWSGLALIPCLTHLAFYHREFIPLCLGFLDSCKSLLILVHLQFGTVSGELRDIDIRLAEDPRFLSMSAPNFAEDWRNGAHTGVDFWTHAEAFLDRRKSGQVSVAVGQYTLYD
ncbi:hypothetical protein C8R43DRAFT_1113438 [Mycena crocata]|nr:hypothetical protein C8R43DRAFT_1113438 [Mycena crocata]